MKYRRAFGLRLTHAFWADGRCTDFSIEPTASAERLMRNHRWICRSAPDGVNILAAVGPDDALWLPLPEGTRFLFHLRLLNSEFPLFTALAGPPVSRVRLFTNIPNGGNPGPGDPTVLTEGTRTARLTETLELPPNAAEGRYLLASLPLPGAVAGDFQVLGLGAGAKVTLEGKPKAIKVSAEPKPQARSFQVTYPVPPRWPPGVFAEVEVAVPPAATLPPAGGPEYQIAFDARSARWKYFLVTDVPAAKDTFAIEAPGAVQFQRSAADPVDPLGRTLLDRFPESKGFRVSCFVSDKPIPCRERGAPGMKLKQGESTVVSALPSPPLRNLCTIGDQQGFFHILERLAKS